MVFLEDLAAPSWRCVRFLNAGAEWPSPAAWAREEIAVADLDAGPLAGEDDLLSALAKAFSFPSYFGGNWDAADECLRDLDWLPARGYVLRVHSAEALWRRLPAAAGTLVEVWLGAAEEWAGQDVAFHLVFLWSGGATPDS